MRNFWFLVAHEHLTENTVIDFTDMTMNNESRSNGKRKYSQGDENYNDNTAPKTNKKPRDNNNSRPISFNICGMNFILCRSKPINPEYLHAFVSRIVRANNLEGNIIKITTNVQRNQDLPQTNVDFVHLIDFVGSCFDNYQEVPSPIPKLKFKIPKNGEDKNMFSKHWNSHFAELARFKQNFGHCNVSRTTKGWDQLGNWLADQRRKLRQGKMTQEQYKKLSDLGVEWDRSYQYAPRYTVDI